MIHASKWALMCVSILFLCLQVKANDIEVLSVIGSHIKQTNLPKITLSSDQIQALSVTSFADVLRGLPGIDISQQGGSSGLTFLSIRGGEPNFVVVLIDGVKVNDPTNSRGGAFDLATFDPNIIEKVDVYYGSFSSVYGSDALSGVLSIQTKQATDERTIVANVNAAAKGVKGASTHISLPLSKVANFNLSASLQDDDNSTFGDAFKRTAFVASIKSSLDTTSKWQVTGFYSQGQGQYFPEDSGGDRLALIREPEIRDYSQINIIAKAYHAIHDELDISFDGASSTRKELIVSPGIAEGILDAVPAIISDTKYERRDFSSTVNYHYSDNLSTALGITLAKELGNMQSIIDFGVLIDANYLLERETKSAFSELIYKPNAASSIVASIRQDQSDVLKALTKRVLANTQINQNTKISAHYSEGFKLPSFFALAHPLVGNPELKPERSKNIELSIAVNNNENNIAATLSVYQNTYSGLVDFDPELFTNVNRSEVRIQGAELSSSYAMNSDINVHAQFTYSDISTLELAENLRRRPKYKSSMSALYHFSPALSFTARYFISGRYFDSSVPSGTIEVKGFTQLDISAHWRRIDHINWRFQVNNLLNSRHEEGLGFRNSGLNFTLSVSKQF